MPQRTEALFEHEERVGECSIIYRFPSVLEMRRWLQKREPGLWYDWEDAETNDGRSKAMQATLRDAQTGAEVEQVLFYHTETHHLERLAVGSAGELYCIQETNAIPRVVETRELIVEVPGGSCVNPRS